MIQLFNSLTKKLEPLEPKGGIVGIYTCGPTVYERAHIGNLASFIYADTLRRAVEASGHKVMHVMNITDVDDKTIAASQKEFPNLEPMEALKQLTSKYERVFMDDLKAIGVDTGKIKFVRATDNIDDIKGLILNLLKAGVAYEAEDGIYFSIEEYRKLGKKYGQLVEITSDSTARSRIENDEYDKDNPHDFALWKKQKALEPAWDFKLEDGRTLSGRPGWHIECSAMSTKCLGQPFLIHTGGVDLKFPHHENEIAQSTALNGDLLAKFFFHSEHMLIDNQKMSKSLNNFLTLEDLKQKGFEPLAFRLFVLEGNYNRQRDFSWQNLEHSANRLKHWRQTGGQWRQVGDTEWVQNHQIESGRSGILSRLQDDLNTAEALQRADSEFDVAQNHHIQQETAGKWLSLLKSLEELFGLEISEQNQKYDALLKEREAARQSGDWQKSDSIRQQLKEQGIGINDTPDGPIWYRL